MDQAKKTKIEDLHLRKDIYLQKMHDSPNSDEKEVQKYKETFSKIKQSICEKENCFLKNLLTAAELKDIVLMTCHNMKVYRIDFASSSKDQKKMYLKYAI